MKTSRYTEAQIIAILRQAEGGVPVAELSSRRRTCNSLRRALSELLAQARRTAKALDEA